ncbi:tape measure protein [Enterobacter cancerogenus]|uniref:tape measure protein n=1 Tax=Enterobacter cancerogenus TaxID=69218 RepID=UPI003828A93A
MAGEKNAGSIVYEISADVEPLLQGGKQATSSLDGMERAADRANAGFKRVDSSTKATAKSFIRAADDSSTAARMMEALGNEIAILEEREKKGARSAVILAAELRAGANATAAQRKEIAALTGQLYDMKQAQDKSSSSAGSLKTGLTAIASAIAVSQVVEYGKRFLEAADAMSQMQARIERLTGSAAAATQTMQGLMRISSATGGSLQDTAKLWETLSTALRDTGATNGQIIQLTETLQKIGRIGGSSTEEMANALRQFGQSISSGTIRAEEFNSILEQMPELARQIAAGMGVSIGELRQLMLDGKLTAEDALNAIQKQTGSVNAEFEKLPRTLSQANTALTNSFLTMVDNINQATGASNGMVLVIDSLAVAIGRLTGQAATASQQIADLRSEAEMYAKRARTWSWLGFGDWQKENEEKSAQLTAEAWEKASRAGWDAVQKTAANTKPIEIKAVAGTGKKKKSQEEKDAEKYAKAQESVNQKLDELRQKAELSAGSVGELSRAQAVLNAQQSLGNSATEDQILLAGQLAGKAWDNANALRAQAKAEKERTDAANKFTSIQGKTSKTAGLDSQYQKDIADIQQYAQLYPQKIGEAEAARAAIEQQYRDQRNAAMWEEWAQQNAATQAAAAAFDSLGSVASNALTGIVTGSMSASDAMRSIGMTVLNSVVNSFVQMGLEWVKSAIMGQTATTSAVAVSTAAQTAGIATTTAASTAAAATQTAAWTPAAMLASISTLGGAAAIGIGAVLGALAMGVAGKRKNGGPVSAGGMYQVGEGGMPEIYQASTGKQYMIPGDNGRVISNKDMSAGGGGGVVINIQNYTSSSVDAQAGTDANGGVTVDVIVADLNNGGPISSGITSNFNVKRTPRGQG